MDLILIDMLNYPNVTTHLHADLGQDALGLGQNAFNERVVENLNAGAHGVSVFT